MVNPSLCWLALLTVALLGCGRTNLSGSTDEAAQELVACFVTPNAIVWAWDAAIIDPDTDGYVLWYGTDRLAVAERGVLAAAWDTRDDANLAWYDSPYGPDLVQQTGVTGLEPAKSYYAELLARRPDGQGVVVATGSATTAPVATGTLTIFSESFRAGSWELGFESTLATEAYQGVASLLIKGTGAWLNGTLGGLAINHGATLNETWSNAYLEMWLNVDPGNSKSQPVPYLEVRLGNSIGPPYAYAYPRYVSLPNRVGWQRVQIPLTAFVNASGVPLTPSTLGPVLDSFSIGANFASGLDVYVDEVVIRY